MSDVVFHRVDRDGLTFDAVVDLVVDVSIEGRRIWSFWTLRDSEADADGRRRIEWPTPLRPHLDGRARVAIGSPSEPDRPFLAEEVGFGDGDHRVEVVNDRGEPLAFDKGGRLTTTFEGHDDATRQQLLDAIETVLGTLDRAGAEPFVAYGTLLGAVREGALLAHDSDADLGYVSHFERPVDVVRESFRLQRSIQAQGFEVFRYSGAAFRIDVPEPGGGVRGVDVFGGFLSDGLLYLMGEVGLPYQESWIRPLTTAQLKGRSVPVPAVPERMLEAMYGPGWKVPDPAFQFETSEHVIDLLNDWFRGLNTRMRYWERLASVPPRAMRWNTVSPAAEAAITASRALGGAEVLDIGAGRGWDAYAIAERGIPVTAYDYVPKLGRLVAERAQEEGLPLVSRSLNLAQVRSVLAEGALLARDPRPRVILARDVLDATTHLGRQLFCRLCSMALRRGGTAIIEIRPTGSDEEEPPTEWTVGAVGVDEIVDGLTKYGGASRIQVTESDRRDGTTVTRIVGEWPC